MAPHKYSSLFHIFSKPLFSHGSLSSTFELTTLVCYLLWSLSLSDTLPSLCSLWVIKTGLMCDSPMSSFSSGCRTALVPGRLAGPEAQPRAPLFPWSFLPSPQAAHPGVSILLKHLHSSLYSSLSSDSSPLSSQKPRLLVEILLAY